MPPPMTTTSARAMSPAAVTGLGAREASWRVPDVRSPGRPDAPRPAPGRAVRGRRDGSARRGLIGPRGVGVRALQRPSLREPPESERPDVHRLGLAVQDQLGHRGPHRGPDLEAGTAEGRGEVETVEAVHAAEDGVAVVAVPVEG